MRSICWVVIAISLALSSNANATTVATLVADFRSDIGQEDSTNSKFTNVQVRRLLTRAQSAVATIIGGVPVQSKIKLEGKKTAYSLSTSLWGYEAVMFKKAVDYINLDRVDIEELGTQKFKSLPTTTGSTVTEGPSDKTTQVEQYAIFDDTLFIYPTLEKPSNDTLYVMGYGATSALVLDTQTVEMKVWTDEFVVEAAVFMGSKRDLSAADEAAFWQSFYTRVLSAQVLYAKKQPELKAPQTGAIQ